ncbi:MAG: hypothetical protein H6622_16460 [Halobacteriovoraceae bacterium]|nr:hypothetical protein [Halobacteriovoraceae bacterium]
MNKIRFLAIIFFLLPFSLYSAKPDCHEIVINILELPKTRYHIKRLFNLSAHQIADIQHRILKKPKNVQERSERIFESMYISKWGLVINKISPFRRWNYYLILRSLVDNNFSYATLKRTALTTPWLLSVHEKRALYILARQKVSSNLFNSDLSLAKHFVDKVMSVIVQNKDYQKWKLGKITIPPQFEHQTSWGNRFIMANDYFMSGLIDIIKYFVVPYVMLDLFMDLNKEMEEKDNFYNERIDILDINSDIILTPQEIEWLIKKTSFE